MQFSKRDLHIGERVFSFQCMTTGQISSDCVLHKKITQRLLRKYCKWDFFRKIPVPRTIPGRCENLFYLGGLGADIFGVQITKPRISWKLSHQQKNTDIMINIDREFRGSDIKCEILPEHLNRSENPDSEFYPDGSVLLTKIRKKALFFIENCAGTETLKSTGSRPDIESKIIRYADIFEHNKIDYYEEHFNVNLKRFRVLYLTTNKKHLNAVSRLVKDHDKHGFTWLSMLSDINGGICKPVWHVPALDLYNQSII